MRVNARRRPEGDKLVKDLENQTFSSEAATCCASSAWFFSGALGVREAGRPFDAFHVWRLEALAEAGQAGGGGGAREVGEGGAAAREPSAAAAGGGAEPRRQQCAAGGASEAHRGAQPAQEPQGLPAGAAERWEMERWRRCIRDYIDR